MKNYEFDSHQSYINAQVSRHKNRQGITRDREKWRRRDINNIRALDHNIKSVLCVGARHESEVESFVSAGYESIGIDVIPSQHRLMKCIDMHNLTKSFDSKSWDLVFSSHSLEHARDPIEVLRQILCVARVGAYFILPIMSHVNESDCSAFSFMSSQETFTIDNVKNEFLMLGIDSNFVVIDAHIEKQPIVEGHIYIKVAQPNNDP